MNELIKEVGHSLWTRIYRLILKMWNTEQMPNEWTEGIICPIFKKGNKKDCNNYRTIPLLNTTHKIFTTILYKRISKYAEQRIGEYQTGFRSNKSMIDNIHMLRHILEKGYEFTTESYIIHRFQASI